MNVSESSLLPYERERRSKRLQVALPGWFLVGYGMLLSVGALTGLPGFRFWHRACMVLLALIAAAAIITSLYLTWSMPGSPIIEGFQGRYLLPVALPFFCAFSWRGALRYEGILALLAGVFSGLVSLQALYLFYYLR